MRVTVEHIGARRLDDIAHLAITFQEDLRGGNQIRSTTVKLYVPIMLGMREAELRDRAITEAKLFLAEVINARCAA